MDERKTWWGICVGALAILCVIAVCLYGFLPRHPKDYSYLAEYEPVATVNMDDVVLENEAELCYTTHQNMISIYNIYDNTEPGEFVFTYQGMRLYFDYELELIDSGDGAQNDSIIVQVVSTDSAVIGFMQVEIKTRDMRLSDRDSSVLPYFLVGCGVITLLSAVLFIWVDLRGERKKHDTSYAKAYRFIVKRLGKKTEISVETRVAYLEFCRNTLSIVFADLSGPKSVGGLSKSEKKQNRLRNAFCYFEKKHLLVAILFFLASFCYSLTVLLFFFGAALSTESLAWCSLIPLAAAIIATVIFYQKVYD